MADNAERSNENPPNTSTQDSQDSQRDDYNPGRDLPELDRQTHRKSEDAERVPEREHKDYRTGKE